MRRRLILPVVLLLTASVPARANVRVVFPKGRTATTVTGSIAGYTTINYLVSGAAGQLLKVTMAADNAAAYFNVFEPGRGPGDAAIFIGSSEGNSFERTLAAKGDYTVQVYLMRSAARRREKAGYRLTISIPGSATAAPGLGAPPASDARVKGTPYHATGQVPCSMGAAPEGSMQCEFGVIRGKPGNAEVHVTPPGGFERVLTFVGSDVSAGGDAKVKAGKSEDVWLIEVNDYEHYRIPDAVISGG